LNTFIGKHIYSKGMGGNLLNLLRKHEASLTADPTHYVCIAAKNALALKNPTLEQFDEAFTRIGGGPPPHFPFPSSDDYYVWGSSDKVIPNIAVPFLGINADDDPVVTRVPMEGVTNGLVTIRLTRGGGHLGWFTAGDGFVDRWTTRPVLEWLKLMGEDYIIEQGSNPRRMFVDEEGWLREEGMPHLGSKEMKEKIRVVEGTGGEVGILQGL
jgi:predicted alpha/beta-fold hydrolase